MVEFSGVVLTGGASRRMGSDKALVGAGPRGLPLASIARHALVDAGARETLSIGGDLEALSEIGFDAYADDEPGTGPLGGVLTALRVANEQMIMALSCDLLAIDAATVEKVISALCDAPESDAAIPMAQGIRQVLVAAYRRSSLHVLESTYANGERSLQRAIRHLGVVDVLGVDQARLADADSPSDLRSGDR